MKNIYLLDKNTKGIKTSYLSISKIKNNGLTIVDLINSHFNNTFKVLLIEEKDQDSLIKNINNSNENIFWPLDIFANDLVEIENIFRRISLSIYDTKIIPKYQKNDNKLYDLENINNNINFIYYKTNSNLYFSKDKTLEIRTETLRKFSNQRTYISLRSEKPVSRNFNQLLLKDNWYEKVSEENSKLAREFSYLNNLPIGLKNFFPELSPCGFKKINNKKASYKIKFIPGENLAGILLSNRLTKKDADLFYQFILNWLRSVEVETPEKSTISDFLVEKCFQRFKDLKNHGIYDQLNSTCKFLSLKTPDKLLESICEKLKKNKDQINQYPPGYFHGDLCLSNIIYHDDNFFLVDPRGFDKKNPRLNIIYELAKLRHSIISYYDILNSGDASIKLPLSSEVSIEFSSNNSYKLLSKVYYDLIEIFSISDSLIKTVEASLFFSMIPLHREDSKKVLSFYLTSIKIINELEN